MLWKRLLPPCERAVQAGTPRSTPQSFAPMNSRTLAPFVGSLALGLQASAGLITFDLVGVAGSGLLPGNEPGSVGGGTGGEIGAGISYDDVSKLLTINVGWGSSEGFTDLSSVASNSHIHGPTVSNNGNGFTETSSVLFSLTRSSDAVTGGHFTTAPISLSPSQETDLLNGKYYINVHTSTNPGGEMRGFLVAVPEPASASLACAAFLGVVAVMRQRSCAPRLGAGACR